MKNKSLAIFGVGTYILRVLSSATDLEGNSTVPTALIAISGIATVAFLIMAIIRLWKIAKKTAVALVSVTVISFMLEMLQISISPSYGNPIIVLTNIFRLANLVVWVWAITTLFRPEESQN